MLYFTLITFIFVGATKEMIVFFFKRKTRKLNKKKSNWSYTHMLSINKYSPGQKDTAKKSSNYAGGDSSKTVIKTESSKPSILQLQWILVFWYILGLNVHWFTLVLKISVNCYLQSAKGTFLNRNLDASNQLTSKKFSYFNQCWESMV